MSMKLLLPLLAVLIFGSSIFIVNKISKRTTTIPDIIKERSVSRVQNDSQQNPRLSIVAKNLEIPWALAFLPDGEILLTERPGRVKMIDKDGNVSLIATITDVKHIGEGGLLGIALHPNFSSNNFVYLYYTYEGDDKRTLNRVVRFKVDPDLIGADGQVFKERAIIVDAIPGAPNHNGGRMKFGPDGFLYVTTGDAQNPSFAQDVNSLAGKILRVTDQGKPAPGNPFGNEVFSHGHRNPQGLAFDEKGNLWATEHGQSAQDEVNKIEPGKNYGWPTIRGDQTKENMLTPLLHSGKETWAPSGATLLNGSIFFAGLRGEALYEVSLNNLQLKTHLKGELGRIREVVLGPDNMLYITTSNRDGRGIPGADDDRIIKVDPRQL